MGDRIRFLAAVVLLVIGMVNSVAVEEREPSLIRLHVLANSNSAEDQALKYAVRDRIVQMMGEKFRDSSSIEEAREILLCSLPQMEAEARAVLRQAGSADEAAALYGRFDFPTRYYGQFALPAGSYEAVRLVIGEGQGANWWCVLFPPLCFVEDTKQKRQKDKKESLRDLESYIGGEKKITIRPAWKILEIWDKIMTKLRR